MNSSYIVLGWDNSISQAAEILLKSGAIITVVSESIPSNFPPGLKVLQGSPTESESLLKAGIKNANGILIALPETLARRAVATARNLNSSIYVVASLQESQKKTDLWSAGANVVVNSKEELARAMVQELLKDSEVSFDDQKMYWAKILVTDNTPWIGMRLSHAREYFQSVIIICALSKGNNNNVIQDENSSLSSGDILVVLGTPSSLESLLNR